MRRVAILFLFFLFTGCNNDELSWISIRNDTSIPIYVLPYTSDYSYGEWIQPWVSEDFYSLNCDCLDGFAYFSFYYDSLIVIMKDQEETTVKFYKDGTTLNYDPTLNPFINRDVWKSRSFDRHLSSASFNTLEEKHIFDTYFCFDAQSIKSLSDTITMELHPAK
jgi:hypothetical protein